MRVLVSLGALALVAGVVVSQVGCLGHGDDEDESEGDAGIAQIAISQVPGDGSVGCIAVQATGNFSVTRSEDVMPGQSTVLDLKGLPVGTVSFLGKAYQGSCAAVTPSTEPTWLSEPVLASVNHVQPVVVHLVMHKNGKADVDVDFDDDTDCSADGAPCLGNAECCSQSCVSGSCQSGPPACGAGLTSCGNACVDLMTDPVNCGGCSVACPTGSACQNGACLAPSCSDTIKNGTETDVDCGGVCPDCATGKQCVVGADCQDSVCLGNVCAAPSCADGVQNGFESDVDCGGPCAPCFSGSSCTTGSDCQVGLCINATCAECQSSSDCPGQDTECQSRTCAAGTCGTSFAASGTPLNTQIIGDCISAVCDGAGNAVFFVDDADIPNDANQCTTDLCLSGSPTAVNAPAGTSCNQSGGTMCNGAGSCI